MVRLALDRLCLIILAALIVVPPWIFGGTLAATQVWLLGGAFLALCLAVLARLGTRQGSEPPILSPAVYPLVGALVLGLIQLVPLGPTAHQTLSPQGRSWWLELTRDDPNPAATTVDVSGESFFPISLYPASTRHDLALLALAAASLLLGSLCINTGRLRLAFCGLAAVNGAVMSFFGIVQQLTWNGKLYWSVPLTQGGIPFAGFVNRNNAAGYLNMCLALSLGLLVWSVTRFRMSPNHPMLGRVQRSKQRPSIWAEVLASLDSTSVLAMTSTVLIVAGVLCSLSRGAAVGLIGAALITTLLVASIHRGLFGAGTIGAITVVGLALTTWLGRAELLQDRFATLFDEEVKEQRLLHWNDAGKAIPDFYRMGSGIGTYRYTYEPYEKRAAMPWFYHAENQYLESMIEGGLPGFLLLLAAIGLSAWPIARLLRQADDAETNALAVAAVFALSSQVIHSFFDFGLYMPSNAMLLAFICGAAGRRLYLYPLPHWRDLTRKAAATTAVVTCLVAALLGIRELRPVAEFEHFQRQKRTLSPDSPQPENVLDDLRADIERLSDIAADRPDDAQVHYRLAMLWSAMYRAETIAELRQLLDENITDDELRRLTSLRNLHRRAHSFVRNDELEKHRQLRQQPLVQRYLRPALRHLIISRRACPLIPKVHLTIAELHSIFDESCPDQQHVQRALKLAPGDPDILFRAGLLDIQAGRLNHGVDIWRQCLEVSPTHWREMERVGTRALGAVNFYRQVLKGLPEQIIHLAENVYRGQQHAVLRLELASLAEQEIQNAGLPTAQATHLQASVHALRGDWLQAVELLEQAVGENAGNIEWRYELAKALVQAGQTERARTHALLCVRLRRNQRKYRSLLRQIDKQLGNVPSL